MKKILITLIIILTGNYFLAAQTWKELATQPNIKFDDVVTAFEEEYKIYSEMRKAESETGEFTLEEKDGPAEIFARWYKYNRGRLNPDGTLTNPMIRAIEAELEYFGYGAGDSRSSIYGEWESLGPQTVYSSSPFNNTPGVGRVNCITFDLAGNLYAGSASGGVFKKNAGGNAGSGYTNLTASIPNLSVSSICVNPLNTNEIYILTGDGDGAPNQGNFSTGILKTLDGGISWFQTNYTLSVTSNILSYKMIMMPENPDTMLIASSSGILKTTDGWMTFSTVLSTTQHPDDVRFFDLELNPLNNAIIYASSARYIYRSEDFGNTWEELTKLDTISNRIAISICDGDPDVLYALAGEALTGMRGLYNTNDGGDTWVLRSMDPAILDAGDGATPRNGVMYDHCLLVNPTNSSQVWVGAIDLWRSDDAGVTWGHESDWNNYLVGDPKTHPDFHDLVYRDGAVFLAHDGGVVKRTSDALGLQFENWYTGLNITQFGFLELDPTAEFAQNLAGAQDNGVQKWDGDDNFEMIAGGDGGEALVDFTNNDRLYFYLTSSLMKDDCDVCIPGGLNFTATCGCPDAGGNPNLWTDSPIEMDPNNYLHVIAGFGCLHETFDGGSTWSLVPDVNLTCGGAVYRGYYFGEVHDWAYTNAKIFHEDVFAEFEDITTGIPLAGAGISGLAVSPYYDETTAWVTLDGYMNGNKVFETTDGGATWTNISGTLPNVPVNVIVFDDVAGEGLYIGTDIGVFYRDYVLNDWVPFRNGLPSTMITDMEISHIDGKLYVSTYGRGLWRSTRAEACESIVTVSTSLPAYQKFESSQFLTSTAAYTAGYLQEAYYTAGEEIILDEGFETNNGSLFNAEIGDCTITQYYPEARTGYLIENPESPETSTETNLNNALIEINVYPNPFVSQTNITISLFEESPVNMYLQNINGQKLQDLLLNKELDKGKSFFNLNFSVLPSGIYLLTVETNTIKKTIKIIKN